MENEVQVSPGNPCPVLRALVAEGLANDQFEPVGRLAETICRISALSDGGRKLSFPLVALIALTANGLSPATVRRNRRQGVHIAGLRDGPLYKHGAGSRVLDHNGEVDETELARLASFSGDKPTADGGTEPGLDASDIERLLKANWQRAKGGRRAIDRGLMRGEWPVLLRVLGKNGPAGRYLALADIRRLVVERKLPERISRSFRGSIEALK